MGRTGFRNLISGINQLFPCINTHRGLYKFDRLVFWIKVAPAIFQQLMDTMLGGFDFTYAYLDDIIISSKTKELHRKHLKKVFAQIREFGFNVKEAKCDFCMNKIKYLGHIIDKDGRRPDPERATAIKDMPTPLIMLRHYRAYLDFQTTTKVS